MVSEEEVGCMGVHVCVLREGACVGVCTRGGGVAHVSVPVCICVHHACASVRVYLPCVGMSLHACVHVCVYIRVQVCVHVWVCVSMCA